MVHRPEPERTDAEGRSRLYQKNGRYYGDFRDYRNVGGRQEALIADGQRYATKSEKVAKRLANERIKERAALRRGGHDGEVDLRQLGPFVDYHLVREAKVKERGSRALVAGRAAAQYRDRVLP